MCCDSHFINIIYCGDHTSYIMAEERDSKRIRTTNNNNAQGGSSNVDLPFKRVVIYKNGVAYFER